MAGPTDAAGDRQAHAGAGLSIAVDGGRLLVVPGVGEATAGDATAGDGASPHAATAAADAVATDAVAVFLHGAGTGTDTPLFGALAGLLGEVGVRVARLEMPYRVAGRRAPDRPTRLDAVAAGAVEALGAPRRLVFAGASMGSRVAVRVAAGLGACGVLALGFPLQPPGMTPAGRVRPSRQDELDGAGVRVLVVQGERDVFGRPRPDPALGREIHLVEGADHSFRTRRRDGRPPGEAVAEAAGVGAAWLLRRLRESAVG